MQSPLNSVTDQERFIREFIKTYKEHPVLWDKNHPHYRSKSERCEAYEPLVLKCREYYPEADEDFTKMKIDSLRSSFRKEWKKVCSSKKAGRASEDLYKPSLWYYNLLLFTVGEECHEEDNITTDFMRLFWTREYTTLLIGLLKKHPCLYSNTPIPTLAKRKDALKTITRELNAYTGKTFTVENIRRKIQLLKGQYRFEYKKIRDRRKNNPKKHYRSNLWCYNMLNFLKGNVLQNQMSLKNSRKPLRNCEPETELEPEYIKEDPQNIKEEVEAEDCQEGIVAFIVESDPPAEMEVEKGTNYDDIFDVIGKNVAQKIRDMPDDQRKYAEKVVNEVMYYGLMECLTDNSRLSIDGT